MDLFDQVEDSAESTRPKSPVWAIDMDDEKKITAWLNAERDYLLKQSEERLSLIFKNEALYRGIQYQSQEMRRDLQDRAIDKSRQIPKIVCNLLYDFTQNRVGRLVKYKPAVVIMPNSNEHSDKIDAKITKSLLDHIQYNEDFEGDKTPKVALTASIKGEVFLWIDWNADRGDLHPDSPKDGQVVELKDESGKPVLDEDGKPQKVSDKVRIGDVTYEVVQPEYVLLELKQDIDLSEYCFRARVMPLEEAKRRWPKKADKLKANMDKWSAHSFLKRIDVIQPVVIWEFWHKKTKCMPEGRTVLWTDETELENTEHKFSHGEFPFERFTDIDEPGKLHGISFFETIKGLTSTYNNLTNAILKNQMLCASPKWMLPAGAAKVESLGNDITVVQYKGPQAPQLVQMNPTGQETFAFREKIKEESQQIAGVFGVSRGEPPPGIKAGVALQFLNEQEAERANLQVLKWNAWQKKVAMKTLAVAGDYYDTNDKRMIRIVGKNDQWEIRFFDAANLSKSYDIKIQNSSALPQSKAARTQTIMDLEEKFPGMLPREQVVELLDLGQSDGYISLATAAVRSAEAENEAILSDGKQVLPMEYEDLLLHWQVHAKAVQNYSFKNDTPPDVQKKMLDHIKATEMLMAEKAKVSNMFAQKLAALDLFPLVFVLEQPELEVPTEGQLPPPGGAMEGPLPVPPPLPENPELPGALPADPSVLPVPPVEGQTQQPLPPEPGSIPPSGAV